MLSGLFASEQLDFSFPKCSLLQCPDHTLWWSTALSAENGLRAPRFIYLLSQFQNKEEGELPGKCKMKVCQTQHFYSPFCLLPAPMPPPLFSGHFLLWPLPGRTKGTVCQQPVPLFPGNALRLCPIQSRPPPWSFIPPTGWGHSLSPNHCPESVPLSRTRVGAAGGGQGHRRHPQTEADRWRQRVHTCVHTLAPAGEEDARGPLAET